MIGGSSDALGGALLGAFVLTFLYVRLHDWFFKSKSERDFERKHKWEVPFQVFLRYVAYCILWVIFYLILLAILTRPHDVYCFITHCPGFEWH
jgi:hypothetical protein